MSGHSAVTTLVERAVRYIQSEEPDFWEQYKGHYGESESSGDDSWRKNLEDEAVDFANCKTLANYHVKLKKLEMENKMLKEANTKNGVYAAAFVWSVSVAAKDINGTAKTYRSQVLSSTPVAGGFVANCMFVEFTKAARRMTREPAQEGETSNVDKRWSGAIQTITQKARRLSVRETGTLFTQDYPEQENPQSALATELIRMALSTWYGSDDRGIVTSHRLEIVANVKKSSSSIHIRKNRKMTPRHKKNLNLRWMYCVGLRTSNLAATAYFVL